MTDDSEAIMAAYYERLRLLFSNYANQPDDEAAQRFRAGIAVARTARDKALQIIKEVKA